MSAGPGGYGLGPAECVGSSFYVIVFKQEAYPQRYYTDGMKVDRSGNIYCSGPGGVWIVSPQGKHLGTIVTPDRVANVAFGDADSKALYMVGGRSLWRIRVNIPGIRPAGAGFGSN